jgi:hypothetical protein
MAIVTTLQSSEYMKQTRNSHKAAQLGLETFEVCFWCFMQPRPLSPWDVAKILAPQISPTPRSLAYLADTKPCASHSVTEQPHKSTHAHTAMPLKEADTELHALLFSLGAVTSLQATSACLGSPAKAAISRTAARWPHLRSTCSKHLQVTCGD